MSKIKNVNFIYVFKKLKLIDKLIKHDERVKDLSDKIINDIHVCASQFDIRKITKFIINDTKVDDRFALKEKMIKFLKVYNWVSSFTHGGPTADNLFFNDIGNNKFSETLEEYKSWSSSIIFAQLIIIFCFFGEMDNLFEEKLKSV